MSSAAITICTARSATLPDFEVIKEKEDFADVVNISVLVKAELCSAFKDKLTDISNGQMVLSEEPNLVADFAR